MQCLEAEDVHTNEPTVNIDNMCRRRRAGFKDILQHMVEETRTERARAEREREEAEAAAGLEQVGARRRFFVLLLLLVLVRVFKVGVGSEA